MGQTDYYPHPNSCLAFSPEGRYLAVGCPDETIRLWDVLSGQELLPLTDHRGVLRALCFTPDGKTLRLLGWDSKVLVWRKAWSPGRRRRCRFLATGCGP